MWVKTKDHSRPTLIAPKIMKNRLNNWVKVLGVQENPFIKVLTLTPGILQSIKLNKWDSLNKREPQGSSQIKTATLKLRDWISGFTNNVKAKVYNSNYIKPELSLEIG